MGVDVKTDGMQRNNELVRVLGISNMAFHASRIDEYTDNADADVVLALHACDTATDDALEWAVRHNAKVILSVPCCHHAVQAQLPEASLPDALRLMTRHGIMRERFGDLLTDAMRAALLRQRGYRVDVIEFVSGEHTPRNLMIRAVKTGAAADSDVAADLAVVTQQWGVSPPLQSRLVLE